MLGDLERKWCGGVENFDVVGNNFNIAGGDAGVGVALGAFANGPGHLNDVLGAELVGNLFANNNLGDTGGVTKIDEGNAAVVAATVNPADECNGFSNVGGPQASSVVRTKHDSSILFWF